MLLDAASLYFRAYYALPTSISAPDGTPVNAVRGFLDMLGVLVAKHRPSHIVACLDEDWRPAWRVALVPTYKTHRVAEPVSGEEEVPDELSPQVPILLDVLAALGVTAVGAPNYEADDVIATLATRFATERGVDVVTGDRDLFSLISPMGSSSHPVRVLFTTKGVANLAPMDATDLLDRYGVGPEQYVAMATLRGDTSDGLPGVPGIGEKTAARLITTFGSLEALLAAARAGDTRLTPRVTQKLLEHEDYVVAAARVVTLTRDVALPANLISTAPTAPADPERLTDLARRYNLANPIGRISAALYGT